MSPAKTTNTTTSTTTKGEETRHVILEEALRMTSELGIEAVTIGGLARRADMSKSGLYAHFDSKENLQVAILEEGAERFTERVVRPALTAPRGEPRIRALFDRWIDWETASDLPGGCVFLAVASELDDRPGPVREYLVGAQKRLVATLARASRLAVDMGDFRPELDTEQFAFDVYSLIHAFHFFNRLLEDPEAETRTRRSFERLLASCRASAAAA